MVDPVCYLDAALVSSSVHYGDEMFAGFVQTSAEYPGPK